MDSWNHWDWIQRDERMEQKMLSPRDGYAELDAHLVGLGARKVLLVAGGSLAMLPLAGYFDTLESRLGIGVARFSAFEPNPGYESVVRGVDHFRDSGCDAVVAVGGGSAMDVAKCIKLYAAMPRGTDYINSPAVPNSVPIIAVPTTAGTGSEATRYSIIYYWGQKTTITDSGMIPSAVLMDPSALASLPMYHRKATMMDALCHAIESHWSVDSTPGSRELSSRAIGLVMEHMDAYLGNTPEGNAGMLRAAYVAGQAINLTRTTAGHALSYKLTGIYGLAHGHAVAICVGGLWPYMLSHPELCSDPRGEGHLAASLGEIAAAMGCRSAADASEAYLGLLARLGMGIPAASEGDLGTLCSSVNADRLGNHPVRLSLDAIRAIYRDILRC